MKYKNEAKGLLLLTLFHSFVTKMFENIKNSGKRRNLFQNLVLL